MTVSFKPPLRVVSEYDIRVLTASGHTVRALPLDEFVVHCELARNGLLKRIVEFEWAAGLQSAKLVGTNFQGNVLFVDLGQARGKGARLLERHVKLSSDEDLPALRVRRTGRRLSWWATRVALLKREIEQAKKET